MTDIKIDAGACPRLVARVVLRFGRHSTVTNYNLYSTYWVLISVCCECCVLSGRGICVGLIIRPEESYRVWCV
jgi:hypothetical protein